MLIRFLFQVPIFKNNRLCIEKLSIGFGVMSWIVNGKVDKYIECGLEQHRGNMELTFENREWEFHMLVVMY